MFPTTGHKPSRRRPATCKPDGSRPRAPGATKIQARGYGRILASPTGAATRPRSPHPQSHRHDDHRRRHNRRPCRHRRHHRRHRRHPPSSAVIRQTGGTTAPLPPPPVGGLLPFHQLASHQPPSTRHAPQRQASLLGLLLLERLVRAVHARVRGGRASRRGWLHVVTRVRLMEGHLGRHKRVERGGLKTHANRVNDLGQRRAGRAVPGGLRPAQLLTEAHGDGGWGAKGVEGGQKEGKGRRKGMRERWGGVKTMEDAAYNGGGHRGQQARGGWWRWEGALKW